jgi:ethanolaminephosphotransferase
MIKDAHEKVIAKIILHFWIGKLFFFYQVIKFKNLHFPFKFFLNTFLKFSQGNSNSLSTIDTNAGFVGQNHVNLFIIFIFSTINTFNSQIFSLTLLIQHLKDDSKR